MQNVLAPHFDFSVAEVRVEGSQDGDVTPIIITTIIIVIMASISTSLNTTTIITTYVTTTITTTPTTTSSLLHFCFKAQRGKPTKRQAIYMNFLQG